MPTKTILVLANSLKAGGRCIAGREILWRADGRYYFGPWIRPVSAHGTGELYLEETCRADDTPVAVMDFASVELIDNCGEKCQPENWIIKGPRAWAAPARAIKAAPIAALEEHPAGLWLDPGEVSDRITPDRLRAIPEPFSLAVIRPTDLELGWWVEENRFKKRLQKKFRARFTYNHMRYDLSLTDPAGSDRFCVPAAQERDPPRKLTLKTENGPLLCVSLTPLFGGFHYKVAATILGCD